MLAALPEIRIASRICIGSPAPRPFMEAHMADAISPTGRLLRRREVEHEVGLSRSSIYRLMEQGKFPRPLQTAERAVRWPSDVIDAWKRSRLIADPKKN